MFFQVCILDARFTAWSQGIGHAQDDEASALTGIEDARSVVEPACLGAKFPNLAVSKIQCEHGSDRLRDLLAVGAHILYGGSAHAARNAAETFHARTISGDGTSHEPVPFLGGEVAAGDGTCVLFPRTD